MKLLLVISVFIFSTYTWASIPPSEFLVKSVAKKKNELRTVIWRSTFTKGELKLKVKTKVDWQDKTIRTRISDEQEQPLYDFESKIIYDRSQNAGESLGETVLAVATSPDYKTIENALITRGVPVKTEEELSSLADENERRNEEVLGLGRMDRRFAWVIGSRSPAKKGEISVPQLWIEKDSFFPMKIVLADSVEARFENFRDVKGQTLPRIIHFQIKSVLLREEWGEVDVNSKTDLVAGFQPGWTSSGKMISGDLREMAEEIARFAR